MARFTFPGRGIVCCVWIWFLLWFWFSFWSWFWFCSWSHHITYSAVNASISGYAVSSKGPWVVPMGSTECRQTNKLVVHILHRTSGLVTRAKIFHSTCLTQLEPVAWGERSCHPIERFSMQIQLLLKMSIKNRNWNVNNLMLLATFSRVAFPPASCRKKIDHNSINAQPKGRDKFKPCSCYLSF